MADRVASGSLCGSTYRLMIPPEEWSR
jgi:hypothetical protein